MKLQKTFDLTRPETLPFVSVICPTYNRREFLPYLLYIYQSQDYPAERRELVILDDSPQSNEALLAQLTRKSTNENIRYIYQPKRLPLGKKRNMLNQLAKGEYIICMDDDDYYAPDKVSYTVQQMVEQNARFSGSDQILIWYSHLNKIYLTRQFGNHHALNGTFAYHRRYLKKHRYVDSKNLAEEIEFLNNYTTPVLQIAPEKAILCISHDSNTFNKNHVMRSCSLTPYKLEDLVQDKLLLAHYNKLSYAPITTKINWQLFTKVVIVQWGEDEERLSRELLALGVAEQQLVTVVPSSDPEYVERESKTHITVLQRAQKEGWGSYLLLDQRLQLVKQENMVNNVNRFFKALSSIEWDVVLLGAEYLSIKPLDSLLSVARVNLARFACAYAVKQHYYAALLENFEQGLQQYHQATEEDKHNYALDFHWNALASKDRWLGLYPSMGYLEYCENDKGELEDCTYRFFRLLSESKK